MSDQTDLFDILQNCIEVQDADEETFELFSQPIPSADLGFVNAKAPEIDFDIGQKSFSISQSPGLLSSDRAGGTTGAVVWKVTPLVAEWLTGKNNILWQARVLRSDATVIEVGCGINGLIGLSLHEQVRRFVLTDQPYVMKVLRQNLAANIRNTKGKSDSTASDMLAKNLHLVPLDWEEDSAQNLSSILDEDSDGMDLLIACDCIYNDFLIRPFVETCTEICHLRTTEGVSRLCPTVVLVAQQQRSDEVFQNWLQEMLKYFCVWRLPDTALSNELRSGHGYVVHLAALRTLERT